MAKPTSWDDGRNESVESLSIVYGPAGVRSIRVQYMREGNSYWAPRHGGDGPYKDEIKLEKDEHLTSVTGFQTSVKSKHAVQRLQLTSNYRTFGPYGGGEGGDSFSIVAPEGEIITGFHGTSNNFLNSIDAHFGLNPNPDENSESTNLFGGSDGDEWDDRTHEGIREILVNVSNSETKAIKDGCNETLIESISVKYVDEDEVQPPRKHGGERSVNQKPIVLDENEHLILVSGYYAKHGSNEIIRSLTLRSNKRTYGPYGNEKGTHFTFGKTNSKIIGFRGRSKDFIHAIGAHLIQIEKACVYAEPVGCKGGTYLDHGDHFAIKEIKVGLSENKKIKSISVVYADAESEEKIPAVDDEAKTETVTLHRSEYLNSVSGFYSEKEGTISSLTFHTNLRTLKAIGTEEGKYFSFPSIGEMIVGFSVCSTPEALKSIGGWVFPLPPPSIPFRVGPVGGQGGKVWEDSNFSAIKGLVIGHGRRITSIIIYYDDKGRSIRKTYGTTRGGPQAKVDLDYPNEFIISIEGCYAKSDRPPVICSLTVLTNKRTFGPFGSTDTRGEKFTLSSSGGKIVGLSGRYGNYIDALGIISRPIKNPSYYETGRTYGAGTGEMWDHGVHSGIRKIQLSFTHPYLTSFCVEYDEHGHPKWSKRNGGHGGDEKEITFDYPGEYLIKVEGRYRYCCDILTSLTFHTNKKTHGPYGYADGIRFSFPEKGESKVVGFHGKAREYKAGEYHYGGNGGIHINAIGAYWVPLPIVSYESKRERPFGWEGGDAFDDGVFDTIRNIHITVSSSGIESIKFDYDRNGHKVEGIKHGKKSSSDPCKIELDYPNEFLMRISGSYGQYSVSSPGLILKSLKFHTNRKTFGPYGADGIGQSFSSEERTKVVAGLHGTESDHIGIHSLGVYLKPIPE